MDRYVCIHGHFYQPPRENPWTGLVDRQETAAPFHDWNQRVAAECYAPNAEAKILDEAGKVAEVVNNYTRISFNFGPTLLTWMQREAPDIYRALLDADRESAARYSGHGSAIAQAHSHVMMPLANRRDKQTQVIWGVRDFRHRFGRAPEGMWLPEAGVDLESLDLMAGQGIRYTILSQAQAARVRASGGEWATVAGRHVDPTMAYRLALSSGRAIAIFFRDGPIARGVAFEGLLASGDEFAARLLGAFSDSRSWVQLVNVATDGESYGHHHPRGEMALAFALRRIEGTDGVSLTNYGEHLDRCPPTHDVEIFENTSWSCAHGVERWRSHCGCTTGTGAGLGWRQDWRTPLRAALDWLRDTLAPAYEAGARALLRDPWAARDDYIAVLLDSSPAAEDRFFTRHAARALSARERRRAGALLAMQHNAMLMYTSCGWFFDDVSRIETVQILCYAARAMQQAEEILGLAPEPEFLTRLAEAKSNLPEFGDGRRIYDLLVRPSMTQPPAGASV